MLAGVVTALNVVQNQMGKIVQVSFDLDFKDVFEVAPVAHIIVSSDNIVLAASNFYLQTTHKRREDTIGRDLFEAFPQGPAGAEVGSTNLVLESFMRVRQSGFTDIVPELRYDVEIAEGEFQERYWRMTTKSIGPLEEGCLLHFVEEVTETVLLRKREQAATERADEAEFDRDRRVARVLESVSDSFVAMDSDFRVTYINEAGLRTGNTTRDAVIGRVHWDIWPGSIGTPLEAAYRRVLSEQVAVQLEHHYVEEGVHDLWLDIRAYPLDGGIVSYYRDITEQKHSEEALRESERKYRELADQLETLVQQRTHDLEESIRESEAFNYAIAHDLRAPLRAIISTARILLESAGPEIDNTNRALLERQAHNAAHLGKVIDELLRLSRLARVEVVRRPFDMSQLAMEVASEIITACKIEIQEGMTGQGDPHLLRMVLENLIENACKFSPGGGVVSVGKTGNIFWVSDQGVGFDMKYASKLFLPFERLVTEAEFPGTGIGLANVERIVRRHGGRVWAESSPGEGSIFFFTPA